MQFAINGLAGGSDGANEFFFYQSVVKKKPVVRLASC